ncbi:CAT RNA binding domain-containing protein [Clostridium saccharoperbutylacetonicum]
MESGIAFSKHASDEIDHHDINKSFVLTNKH